MHRAVWRKWVSCFALGAMVAGAGCRHGDGSVKEIDEGTLADVRESWTPDGLREVRNVPVEALQNAIAARLESDKRPKGVDDRDWERVLQLYASYGHLPLWLEKDADSERADQLIDALASVHEHGLRGSAYPLEELRAALIPIDKARRPSAAQLAQADVMLTVTYVTLGEDLLTGQIEPANVAQQAWQISLQTADIDSLLARTLRGEPLARAIETMRPRGEQYDALRVELRRYRELATRGGWRSVPDGKSLRPGDTTSIERLAALGKRLAAEEYFDRAPDTVSAGLGIYDAELAGAVAEFQARHGIVVDSILGRETVEAMNLPIEHRIGQIMANLERYRWLPRSLGDRYVYVNVPAFRLDAYDEGRRVLSMKVIVGAEYENRMTPAFADTMRYVEFAPYWNVPEEIAEKEIWPKVAEDPTYLERNEYEVIQEPGGTRVRQRPGKKNALGAVKFMFPNPLNIYMHDTPERQLFAKDVRGFSHGCIRVEKPEELAVYALSTTAGWNERRVRKAIGDKNRQVRLAEGIPVYIVYFTTFVRDGKLYFGNDVYERDRELIRIVERAALPSPREVALLQELRQLVD